MTEPTVKVSNNAASPFNLSFDAKVPAGNPVVSTEGDLVEVIKKLFRQNGASWTVGMLSMVNILAVMIHLEQIMVPEAYWDECVDAIRDYCKLINKSDIEREVANFRARQYEMLAQLKTAPGEGGGTAQSTRSKKTKEGGAAEDRPPDDAGEVSIGARSKRIASFVKLDAWASSDKDVSEVMEDLSGFSPEAHDILKATIHHSLVANRLVEAQLRKIAGNEISSIIENARLLSASEKRIQAPKLYGIFGLDPYLYLAIQEIRRRATTNKLAGEALIDADKNYANFCPRKNEDLHGVTNRFEEAARKVVSARDAPIPPAELPVKYIKMLEDSHIAIFAHIGRMIRREVDMRTRTISGYTPSLEDVKVIGESIYKAAVEPTQDSGGGGGGSGSHPRSAMKGSARGYGGSGGGDSGPQAAAHLARGRVINCYNCGKEGHLRYECKEPQRPRKGSRSPSSSNNRRFRPKGGGGGKGSKGGGENVGNAGPQHSANVAVIDEKQIELMERQTAAIRDQAAALEQFQKARAGGRGAASEEPSPGFFA